MNLLNDFRDPKLAHALAEAIAAEADPRRSYRLMEFCGGHTHAICRYGLETLLPPPVKMVHGPGCPVCVLPIGRLDQAIEAARRHGAILCAYGDMMRVPGSDRLSLTKAKAQGADVRMVYGGLDALKIAQDNPDKQVVFFAIGFETTAPATALAVTQAARLGLKNFSLLCHHVLTPAALTAILAASADPNGLRIDGLMAPGHVTAVIGLEPYRPFAAAHRKPMVVTGFEPLDILQSALMLVRQLNAGRHEVENQYSRAVPEAGNPKAQALIAQTMMIRDSFDWRGLGTMPNSALKLRDDYAEFDAERRFNLGYQSVSDHPACACAEILRGVKKPADCKVFATACTPETPIGACMVSPEGSCAAYYLYGRHRGAAA